MEQSGNKSGFIIARTTAMLLVAVVGLTAMFGGAALILDPSGASMGMNTESLVGTIFDDYRSPGVILFLAIGVLGLSVALLTAADYKNYPVLIFYQGTVLTGWIMAQLYLLAGTYILQVIYGMSGIMLMLLGSYLILKRGKLRTLY